MNLWVGVLMIAMSLAATSAMAQQNPAQTVSMIEAQVHMMPIQIECHPQGLPTRLPENIEFLIGVNPQTNTVAALAYWQIMDYDQPINIDLAQSAHAVPMGAIQMYGGLLKIMTPQLDFEVQSYPQTPMNGGLGIKMIFVNGKAWNPNGLENECTLLKPGQ